MSDLIEPYEASPAEFNVNEVVTAGTTFLGNDQELHVVLLNGEGRPTHFLTPAQAYRTAARMVRIANDLATGRDITETVKEND